MRNYDHLYQVFTLKEEYQKNSHEIANHKNQGDRFWQEASVSRLLYEEGFRPQYPDGKKFAACISHDIDLVYNHNSVKGNLFWGTINLLKGNVKKASYHLKSLKHRRINESWQISHTLDILDTYKVKSSFYFLALDQHEKDFNYKLEQLSTDIELIQQKGHEVGLHGGHDAFGDLAKMKEEQGKLEVYAGKNTQGYRSHFLNLSLPETWQILKKRSFTYDASLGFSREVGFRNGMCYPFRPYIAAEKSWMDFYVLPLQIMDVALFLKKNVSYPNALIEAKKVIDENASLGGICTLLWHNNYMDGVMGTFFQEILAYLNELDAWMPTSLEAINWWEAQGYPVQIEKLLTEYLIPAYRKEN